MRCEPATSIIEILGGITLVAKAAEVSTTSVQRWRMPRYKGGTDGWIPRKHHEKLIALGASRDVRLSPAAFIETHQAYMP